jgi:hypothetical protein
MILTLTQCAIPAFDGLLPEPHNSIVCNLLVICAEWHALAKLRMHTEDTLQLLESTTALLARQFNSFTQTTCTAYQTTETSKEYTARLRRATKGIGHAGSSNPPLVVPLVAQSGSADLPAAEPAAQVAPLHSPKALAKGKLYKTFNLTTYKYHALGDYASTIRAFGTTDSYSTERVRHVSFSELVTLTFASFYVGRIGTQAPKILVSSNR